MAHDTTHQKQVFPPNARVQAHAHINSMVQYEEQHAHALGHPEEFWAAQANKHHWFKRWTQVLNWQLPDAQWFVGGKTNICYNAVDRHVEAGLGDKTAILWEGEPYLSSGPEVRRLTYKDLQVETSKCANVLKSLGVKKGDIVTLYMPMVPELAIAMLACARIGAPHSIIFAGFSAAAIKDRIEDANSKVVITSDAAYRRGKVLPLKAAVDEALNMVEEAVQVRSVLVLNRCSENVPMRTGRDVDWHTAMQAASADCACEEMDSEDLLFLLYTSGTTGKPKGIMHTTGGYMVYTACTARLVFDLHPEDPNELYWCTADIGWITGHSYIIYGILQNGVTSLMYEGAPNYPEPDRFWDIVERHRVTKFYTAPTAVRAFMKWGDAHVDKHDMSSLKILGSVGEPINPEAWRWYHEKIGGARCPIVDTWWQTETGGHMLTPLPGCTPTVPGSATRPFLGIDAAVVDEEGQALPAGSEGLLVIRKPWPGMLRGVYGDRERFIETYWSKFKEQGMYLAGDAARVDAEGNFWIIGRIDDVINVSGHRLGTAEVESALVEHEAVVEAAVVGVPHEIKGTGIVAFVTLGGEAQKSDALQAELVALVGKLLGSFAKPERIQFTDVLPKTRSGKIMRRLLREIAMGGEVHGDVTTLEDSTVLGKLVRG